MSFVAKTVLIFENHYDVSQARLGIDYASYLAALGGTDHTDLTVLDDAAKTVTRFWTDKDKALTYKDWMTQRLQELDISPVSFVVEDITV